ncbi:MAG: hypothetical protein IJ263_04035, partial [Paludibacteraceae bacterium]|nr:hypothetical protein [Paludibacteraceae bacterium]
GITVAGAGYDILTKTTEIKTKLDNVISIGADVVGDVTFFATLNNQTKLSLASGIATILHTIYKGISVATDKDEFEKGLNDIVEIQLKLKKLGISLNPDNGIAEDILSVSSILVPDGTLEEAKFMIEESRKDNGLNEVQSDASSYYFANMVHIILTNEDFEKLTEPRFGELSIKENVMLEGDRLAYFDRSLLDYYSLDTDFKILTREKLPAGLLNKMTGLKLTDDGYAILSCPYNHEYFNAQKAIYEDDKKSAFVIPRYKVTNLKTTVKMLSEEFEGKTVELIKYDKNGNKQKTIRYISTSY